MDKRSPNKEKITRLEKVFQVPARLRIMSALMAMKKAEFNELIHMFGLTRGNLSMHMKLLNEYNYVTIQKKFVNNKPKTTYQITAAGKRDFKIYIEMLENIIATIKTTE